MKNILERLKSTLTEHKKRLTLAVVFLILLHIIVLTLTGLFFAGKNKNNDNLDEENIYQTRCDLLLNAVKQIGVCSSQGAAEVWGEGLVQRNAAMQLSVMSNELTEEYLLNLNVTAPDWVVGASSPSVDGYEIVNTARTNDDNKVIILILIKTATSSGAADEYKAMLTVVQNEDGFWCISKISMDKGLYPYTGFYFSG
ncbi:MAG: hypothetical protein CVU97_01005 [Firmicutes bacterium HGW-Firmicutes-21]|nr:MAG: hypothetical protein CVU97_01005 [Firmicutes bacterium HGW-Firmicutes-21]